ncbi:MAG: hypothetical protein K8R59_04600 [Thermoanaerobaculales bacterium]|nr:hypothetical protein [Thermoanaerobaculales bacterium]
MQPRRIIESVTTSEGTELVLIERGGTFLLEVDGEALMSNLTYDSEEALAQVVISRLQPTATPRLLIGGLGMGFTLRAALDALAPRPRATIEIVEVFDAVVRWNRGVLAHLAGNPLADPRVRVRIGDVARTIEGSRNRYDAILLDIDNGPEALTLASNHQLYNPKGLQGLKEALTPDGVLGLWSASDDRVFRRAMGHAGFKLEVVRVRARSMGRGRRHVLFLGRR